MKKFFFIFLILAACLVDTITFLMGNTAFEVNPIFLITGSIGLLLGFKFLINGAIAYLIKYGKKTNFIAFTLVLAGVYLICFQLLGAYSNITTQAEFEETKGTPNEIQPLPKDTAVRTYSIAAGLLIYLPIFMALISFKLWEVMYNGNINK